MRHIHQDVIVDGPVEEVFALAAASERQSDWNPYVESRGFSGPLDRAGTTFESTMHLLGQKLDSRCTVEAVDPNRLIHIHAEDDRGGSSDWTFRFEPAGSGTNCSVDLEYEVSGGLASVMDTVVYQQAIGFLVRRMAESFKAIAEGRVPEHS